MLVHVSRLRVDLAKAGQWGIGFPLRCPTDSIRATSSNRLCALEQSDLQSCGAMFAADEGIGRESGS